MHRSALSVFLFLLAVACGDAVTDPARDGFEGNPRLIEGDWATLFITNQGVTRYDAELLPAGGEFLGEFRFFRAGREVRIAFNDGAWDGTRLEFTTDPLPAPRLLARSSGRRSTSPRAPRGTTCRRVFC